MKFINLLPLAVLSGAFVLPDDQVISNIAIESRKRPDRSSKKPCPHHLLDSAKSVWKTSKHTLDDILGRVEKETETIQSKFPFEHGFDVDSWLESAIEANFDILDHPNHPGSPHRGPPGHGPPSHGPPGHGPPGKGPHHGPPGKRPGKKPGKKPWKGRHPHHPPHHGKPNSTIYELISKSKYTTKLAKIIDEDKDLVDLLNSTKANFTLFAPTDHAFSKIPEHAKPPKELIKKVLLYHISPGLFPAGRLLFTHTVPTSLNETLLGDNPQRLVARAGLRGVFINYYSKVVAVNIPATNGLIHGVDSILLPPPTTLKIISLLPTEFSTLSLGLKTTGLEETLNSTAHAGGTFFAPSNTAFKKLGPRVNAFLFSKFGKKYLKALLEYHVVANQTLYSNTFYPAPTTKFGPQLDDQESSMMRPPYVHLDLPTLLEDKALAIDLTRYGPFISFKINGFVRVVVQDGLAKDGVIQVVSDVLIPPKSAGGPPNAADYWNGDEMSVEEFTARLDPLVKKGSDEDWKLDL